MTCLRIAVIGGGHLGAIHARLVGQVPDAELVAIVEPDAARAAQLADEFSCPIVTDPFPLIQNERLDAAILAAPTSLHHDIGMLLLKQRIHALVEKPLAPTLAECERLVAAADQAGCVLQVGHVERFNPAWTSLAARLGTPRLIETVRQGPLSFRSLDVGVVLDLMIHDIDLVLSIVQAPVISVQAVGIAWTGPHEDVADARITFANGCVAHCLASRVSCEPVRRMQVYGDEFQATVDFADRRGYVVGGPERHDWQSKSFSPDERRQLSAGLFEDILPKESLHVAEGNPILDELEDFVAAIRGGTSPRVSGRDGLAAVDIATQVIQRIEQRRRVAPAYLPPTRKAG